MKTLAGVLLATVLTVGLLGPGVAAAYETAPVADGGTVTGKVTFKGEAPKPKRMLIAKDTQVCGNGEREIVEVVVNGGGLANAVVVIEGIAKGKPWSAAPQKPLLDQKGCTFIPGLLVVPRNGDIDITNNDPVLHNIHTYEIIGAARRTLFNFGQPNQGQRITKPVQLRRGEWVKVECDAHDFMHAWMFSAPSPYYAVTGADGAFAIADVPAGKYRVRVVHPVLGAREGEVTVSARGRAELSVAFTPR